MTLLVLSWLIFVPAIYKRSTVGLVYASLIVIHAYVFGFLVHEDSIHLWAMTAGIYSFISMEVCHYLKKSALDDIAFYLYTLSVFTLSINLVTLIMWYLYFDLEVLNSIFAGISILSIGAIAGGDHGPRDRNIDWGDNARDFIDSRTYNVIRMVRIKRD